MNFRLKNFATLVLVMIIPVSALPDGELAATSAPNIRAVIDSKKVYSETTAGHSIFSEATGSALAW